MSEATQKITILQGAVDLEMATDAETTSLPLWKKYRMLLRTIEASKSGKIE
jgi:hypothetical protein